MVKRGLRRGSSDWDGLELMGTCWAPMWAEIRWLLSGRHDLTRKHQIRSVRSAVSRERPTTRAFA